MNVLYMLLLLLLPLVFAHERVKEAKEFASILCVCVKDVAATISAVLGLFLIVFQKLMTKPNN